MTDNGIRTVNEVYDLILAYHQELRDTAQLTQEVKLRIDALTSRVLAVLGAHERHEQRLIQLAERVTEHASQITAIHEDIVDLKSAVQLNKELIKAKKRGAK